MTSTKDPDSPFCLLLKKKASVRVGPKSTLDIPVCFAPTEMTMYEALCTVIVRKEDGGKWKYSPTDADGYVLLGTFCSCILTSFCRLNLG